MAKFPVRWKNDISASTHAFRSLPHAPNLLMRTFRFECAFEMVQNLGTCYPVEQEQIMTVAVTITSPLCNCSLKRFTGSWTRSKGWKTCLLQEDNALLSTSVKRHE